MRFGRTLMRVAVSCSSLIALQACSILRGSAADLPEGTLSAQSPEVSAVPGTLVEFTFDRRIAIKKARAYLANEFGTEDLSTYWHLETPTLAAIRVTDEEARGNCFLAGRYVIVQFDDVKPPGTAIFLVLGLSDSWVWEEETWISGPMTMPEVVRDIRTGAACC